MPAKLFASVQFTTKTGPTPMIFWFWTRPAFNATPDPLKGHCGNNLTCVQLICLASPKSTANAKVSWVYA